MGQTCSSGLCPNGKSGKSVVYECCSDGPDGQTVELLPAQGQDSTILTTGKDSVEDDQQTDDPKDIKTVNTNRTTATTVPDVMEPGPTYKDDLMDVKAGDDLTILQHNAIVMLQRNFRGTRDRRRMARRCSELQSYDHQDFLGKFRNRYMIAKNLPINDEKWNSTDPAWVGRASMSRLHRMLIRRDLHWRFFNSILFGMIAEDGTLGDSRAADEVQAMKEAALLYVRNARQLEGWSNNTGLFYHVFGHNSVMSLHLHIIDLDDVGPSFHKMVHKNCPIDDIIRVLKDERKAKPKLDMSWTKGTANSTASIFGPQYTDGGTVKERITVLKQKMTAESPIVNNAATYKEARESLWRLGGPDRIKRALEVDGYLKPTSPMLTTGTKPFNVFARLVDQDAKLRNVTNTLRAYSVMKGLRNPTEYFK